MRIVNDEADTLLFPNTHEAIVDEETFEIVWNLRKNKRCKTKYGEQPMFSGLVYCADCGTVERIVRGNGIGPKYYSYNCGTYRNKAKEACTPHGIRVVVLERLLLEHIRMVTGYISENERDFAEKLMQRHSAD